MKRIVTADLHFTDSKKDEYRFGIFEFLRTQIEKYKPDELLIIGDLTEKKNHHSADLVNRIVLEMCSLIETGEYYNSDFQLIILKGNHDYTDKDTPFFQFLSLLNTSCRYVKNPMNINGALYVPFIRDFEEFKKVDFSDSDRFVFLHQPLLGSIAENGFELEGKKIDFEKEYPELKFYSGDIHIPQILGKNWEYVGAPYFIKYLDPEYFGTDFKFRVLYLEGENKTELFFKHPSRWTLNIENKEDLSKFTLEKGDFVKVKIQLANHDLYRYEELRKEAFEWAKENAVNISSVKVFKKKQDKKEVQGEQKETLALDPVEVLGRFSEREKIDIEIVEIGMEFL